MNSVQIFNNERFGRVRVAMTSDKPMFLANDVAKALGYVKPANAISSHCKGVTILVTPTDGGAQPVKYIPESDVYRLVMRSKLPQANSFRIGYVTKCCRRFAKLAATWWPKWTIHLR